MQMITFCRHCEEVSTMEMEVIKGEVLLLKAPKEGSEADQYVEVMCVLSDIYFGVHCIKTEYIKINSIDTAHFML